jgi:CBS domain-containing protein
MNAITMRIAEFLKGFPPFHYLEYDNLLAIAQSIRVINLEKNKTLFQINETLHDSFYVVASGAVNLTVISDAEESLLNKCYPGDVFGLRPFFAKNNYQMTAKAREESVVFAVPIAVFRPFVAANGQVLDFLLESFASNTVNPHDKERSALLTDSSNIRSQQSEIQYYQTLSYNKTPLVTASGALVKDIAQAMTDNLMDSVIITHQNLAIGIITDMDLREKVATGRFSVTTTADKIMSAPVITVPENVSLAEAQLLLLTHNISHLCVTQDGSDKSEIRGVISQRDLVVAQASNPGVLMKEIKRANNPAALKSVRNKLTQLIQTSISKNIPITHLQNIAGEINLAIVRRSVELAILDMGSPPARFAWLSIGSQGRKEQLLPTDHDSMLVFEDIAAEKYRDVKDYFLKMAKKATEALEKVGYAACPQGHMASNMLWCRSLTEWVKQYNLWMNNPGAGKDISSIFFDYELAIGEPRIEEIVTETVFGNVRKQSSFFDYLGNDALRKPAPLSFFKKFNVEEDGPHKDRFDIKMRAIMPLVDGARLMVLSQSIKGINNTYLRFKKLAMDDPRHADVYLNCAEAFQTLSEIRTEEGLRYDTDGRYVNIDELPKIDREKLKNALAPMKDLEELIKDRFRLTQFS